MTKQELRSQMPETAAFVDWVRAEFGEDAIQAIDAEENGHTLHWTRKERKAA